MAHESRKVVWTFFVAAAVLASPRLVSAQSANSGKSTNSAQSQVQKEQQVVAVAAMHLKQAKADYEHAIQHAARMRRDVEDERLNSPEVKSAKSRLEQCRKELAELTKPILEKLQFQADYRDAAARRDALQSRLKSAGEAAGNREEMLREMQEANTYVRKLGKAAFHEDAKVKAAEEAVAAEEATLRSLSQKRVGEVDHDSRVTEARDAIHKTKDAAAHAAQSLAAENQKLAVAEQSYLQKLAQQRSQQNRSRHRRR